MPARCNRITAAARMGRPSPGHGAARAMATTKGAVATQSHADDRYTTSALA